jgi:hypothetical protein
MQYIFVRSQGSLLRNLDNNLHGLHGLLYDNGAFQVKLVSLKANC